MNNSNDSTEIDNKIHLIGSQGFIGKAIQRNPLNNGIVCWSHKSIDPSYFFDLKSPESWDRLIQERPKTVIILSWPGLPNYNEIFHIKYNLIACIELIEKLILSGVKKIAITGTCYEYGLQNGEMKENMATSPANLYATAKDTLRRYLQIRAAEKDICWCWLRIFYPYGIGQNPKSLLPSLDSSIDKGDSKFLMSSGSQIRDFINVDSLAEQIILLASSSKAKGIYNCGSGNPISILDIVKARIKERNSNILIENGFYPDREDEPLSFWANIDRLKEIQNSSK